MVARKKEKTALELYWPAKLAAPREDFKKIIKERIKIWTELYNIQINTHKEFEDLEQEYLKWNDWNEEYLKTNFNYQDNKYLDEYAYWWGSFIISEKSFSQEVQDKKDDIKEKVNKLDSLLNKADLIPIDEDISLGTEEIDPIKNILTIMNWFHKCAQELRHRYNDRETIIMNNEYDVQDLLKSLLKIFYDDVRSEEYSPSNGWWNSRIDLTLPNEEIIIEVKFASEKLKEKKIGEQIAIDIVRYDKHPDYKTMIVFIYDKLDFIRNKRGLIQDLEKQSKNWKKIIVIINPN